MDKTHVMKGHYMDGLTLEKIPKMVEQGRND
jgi:hypothetical protein